MRVRESRVIAPQEGNKVVFVNRFYWPDESATSQLLTDLAEDLAAGGNRVVIVTSRLNYTSSAARLPNRETYNGVEIYRVWTTAFHRVSLVGRMMDFLTFYIFATVALFKLVHMGDMVVAKTDPPLIQLFAWLVTWTKRAKLINWCQDLFPEVAFTLARRKTGRTIGTTLHHLRNFALQRSEMNVTISEEMGKTLVVQGINANRVSVITNWCDRTITPVSENANTLRRNWQLRDHFVLGYSGNLGRAHVPDKIYALVRELANIPELKMLFIGSGHGMKWLRQRCEEESYEHVVFKPYQPRESLSVSLSVPDLHLISLRSGCQNFLAPSKFYGILAAGRPVAFLGDPDCDLAREVTRSRMGITLALDDVEAWRNLILCTIREKENLVSMAANARRAHDLRFEPRQSLEAWHQIIGKSAALKGAGELQQTASGTY